MFPRLRANGPAVLVPLAWTLVAVAVLDLVTRRTVLIAHLVMAAVLVAFAAASWREMAAGALRPWRTVLVFGLGATILGAAALATAPGNGALLAVPLAYWMLAPAAALADTGRRVPALSWAYRGGAALSALGAAVYFGAGLLVGDPAASLTGIALVGVGQTLGIVTAVVQF